MTAKLNPFIPPTLHLSMDFFSTIFLLYPCQRAFLVTTMRCGDGHRMDALVIKALYLLVPLLFTQSPSRSKGQTCRNTTQSAKIYRNNICVLVLIKTLMKIKAYCFQESLGLPLYRSLILFNHQETAIFFSRWGTMALAPPTQVCVLKRNGCPSM